MQITIDDSGAKATVVLNGRLDILGADVIALPLATLSGSKEAVFIDMAGVTFVASIGLRELVSAAKAIARRGGRLVLLRPQAPVADVIVTSGLSDLLQIERDGV